MERPEVWPPAPEGDETVTAMLERTVVRLGAAVAAQPAAPACLWALQFVDTEHVDDLPGPVAVEWDVHLPLSPVTWRAVPMRVLAGQADPLRALVGWEPPSETVGLVVAWAKFTPVGRSWMCVAVLRDGTTATSLHAPSQPGAVIAGDTQPSQAAQALRRCLGLPSGLPAPEPSVLLARMHAAVLETVAALPDEYVPTSSEYLELLRMDDPAAADRVEDAAQRWVDDGVAELAVRRGALIATLAAAPAVAASLITHPLAGALIPLVGDLGGWPTVVSRLRATPPASSVPAEWWAWADDGMIAAMIASVLPPLGRLAHMEGLVANGSLPAGAVELSAEAVARIAAGPDTPTGSH